MRIAIALALAALAFPLFAVLNSGAQAQLVIVERNQIKAIETQQVRKRYSPTMTETAGPRRTATASPTATPSKR